MEMLRKELETVLEQNQILQNEPMDRHTTFRVGGPADLYLLPTEEQLKNVMNILTDHRIHMTVIGNGSNLLVGDKGIRGAVIEIGNAMAEITAEEDLVIAKAGALLSRTAQTAYQHGLSGLEFAAGIPGSVGGAVVMNAGAYGGEMKDVVEYVKVLGRDGAVLKLTNEEMEFSYRNSCAAIREYIVLEAAFRLKKSDPQTILQRMEELKGQRRMKQPLEYPSAGSTFKRPAPADGRPVYAAALIDQCGLKGLAVGGAQVSEKHAGFVINRGGASCRDILELIAQVRERVFRETGITLEPEVRCLGREGEGWNF